MQDRNKKADRKPGRPKTSPLSPQEQARERKRRQRRRLAQAQLVKIEAAIPTSLRNAVTAAAAGRSLSAVLAEALRSWVRVQKNGRSK